MAVRIVTGDGHWGYGRQLHAALSAASIRAEMYSLADWQAGGAPGSPEQDIVVVQQDDATHIAPAYGAIAVQDGCAYERLLREGASAEEEAASMAQQRAARRGRTFRVSTTAWAAWHLRLHANATTDRIIYDAVDTERLFPSERQRERKEKHPLVLHGCGASRQGADHVAAIAAALKDRGFQLKALSDMQGALAERLRSADMWLSLSSTGGDESAIIKAMATDLMVVGTNAGRLWSLTAGRPVGNHYAPTLAWANADAGTLAFPWQLRANARAVAEWIAAAWKARAALHPRPYALQWHSLEVFGRKWLEAIRLAADRFGVKLGG
jgi:hypothetical protein